MLVRVQSFLAKPAALPFFLNRALVFICPPQPSAADCSTLSQVKKLSGRSTSAFTNRNVLNGTSIGSSIFAGGKTLGARTKSRRENK